MVTHGNAKDCFKERRDSDGKLKVWEWSEDPRILIRERINASGGLGFRVVLPRSVTGGKEIFVQSRDFEKAKEIARSKGREFRNSRSTALTLGDAQKIQAATAITMLRDQGVDSPLDAIAREYVAATATLRDFNLSIGEAATMLAEVLKLSAPTGKTVAHLVEFAARRVMPAGGVKTVAELSEEMTAIKKGWLEKKHLRTASFLDFKVRAKRIAIDLGGFPLPELEKDTVMKWLVGLSCSPRSKKNYRMTLSEMLRFATQRNYIVDSPLDKLTDDEVKTIEAGDPTTRQPAILSPEQAVSLLNAALASPDLDMLGVVTLGLFCGIRTEELKRLTWDAVRINEPEPFVIIGAEIAKKRRIRSVAIPPNAVAWLKKCDRTGQVTRNSHIADFQKRFRKLQMAAGFGKTNEAGDWETSWETNAMRHSFGSYHYALHGNSLETARLLGHKADDSVLFDHYRALATKAQGEAYFAITPPASAGKVIAFSATA